MVDKRSERMRLVMGGGALTVVFLLRLGLPAQKLPADQWPAYQHNSDFSTLTQITPENVSRLSEAWTFHYGAGSKPTGSLGLDFRFEVQPLIIGGVMYIS